MSSLAEIKHRIASVRDTKKITNAMYLIASTKVRKAKSDLDKTRPYFSAMQKEIARVCSACEDAGGKWFYPEGDGHKARGACGILVITADKGLAGAYNQNVLKKARDLLDEHPDGKLFVVGEYGRQYFVNHSVPFEKDFVYTAQSPTLHRAREICDILLGRYSDGALGEIYVVYTDFGGGRTEHVYVSRLLPLSRKDYVSDSAEGDARYEFEPTASEVLDNVMHSYVSGFVYSALVDSYCCEQNARMLAMLGADNNADEILAELSLEFNRERQAAITQEITEVTSGAKSMKRKGAKQ